MMQTAAVQKISEQNSPYKAMLDRAYMIGYKDAINQERSRIRAARERRERKKYFAMQKLNGVALLIFTAVAIKIIGSARKKRKARGNNEICYKWIKVRYGKYGKGGECKEVVRKQKPTYKGNIQQCESWNYTRLRIMEKQKGKLAFDTYGRLRNESRGSNNRRGSEKPFNEICTG